MRRSCNNEIEDLVKLFEDALQGLQKDTQLCKGVRTKSLRRLLCHLLIFFVKLFAERVVNPPPGVGSLLKSLFQIFQRAHAVNEHVVSCLPLLPNMCIAK